MANSTYRGSEVEDLVRAELGRRFHVHLRKTTVRLSDGGYFQFDAVSESHAIIGGISTNAGITISKKPKKATAKLNKIRSDVMFLLRTEAECRFIALTDEQMFNLCEEQKSRGRMPREIDFFWVNLPSSAVDRLREEHRLSAGEMAGQSGLAT